MCASSGTISLSGCRRPERGADRQRGPRGDPLDDTVVEIVGDPVAVVVDGSIDLRLA